MLPLSATGEQCLKCHGEGKEAEIEISELKNSVHKEINCTDCHTSIKDYPHPESIKSVLCENCHKEVMEKYSESIHGKKKDGKRNAECVDCHGSHNVKHINHFEVHEICGKCHEDEKFVEEKGIRVKYPVKLYLKSIHGKLAVEEKLEEAPNCTTCHGEHLVLPSNDPRSLTNRYRIPALCGGCHDSAYSDYIQGVHGRALERGATDAAVCTDCHGEHAILPPSDKESLVAPQRISVSTCPQCHAAERIVKKYGLSVDSVKTYENSYHGLAYKFGYTKAANCASCHGYHLILPSTDPRSSIHPSNLPKTCGKCHPGASLNFAKGKAHPELKPRIEKKDIGATVKFYVRLIYFILIPVTILGMFFHNLLDYIYRLRIKYRELKEKGGYLRLTLSERIQHAILLITFFTLAISGFALKFKWSIPWFESGEEEVVRRGIHRVAAILFVIVSIYHIYYLIFTKRGREWIRYMFPSLKDIKDVIGALLHYLGLGEHPKFDRFSYIEKAEYYALIWGSVIMIVTGFVMWFETEVMKYLPLWFVDVCTMIHYYEAILATLAIFVWHLYHVLIKPGAHKTNIAFIAGKLSEEEMEEEHPLELERIKEKKK